MKPVIDRFFVCISFTPANLDSRMIVKDMGGDNFMNTLVLGAGALGVYFGGRLLEAGQNVSFFVREKRAAQLTKEGLKISSPKGNFEVKDVTIYTSPEKVRNIDLVILAVKGYHLDQ